MEPLRFDLNQLTAIVVEDIDTADFPDFSDAYIEYAVLQCDVVEDYRVLTQEELDIINTVHRDFVNECVFDQIHIG